MIVVDEQPLVVIASREEGKREKKHEREVSGNVELYIGIVVSL
jgi:uncharacterized protein YceH (UPF0502 family)